MNFLPSNLSSSSNQSDPIQKVMIAAHTPAPLKPGSSKKINHWCIYLQISDQSSIRLDMQPSGDNGVRDTNGFLGTLIIQRLSYVMSSQAVKRIEISKRTVFALKDVISEIEAKGYHKYDFNEKGIGCRYWVTKVLKLLKDKGYIGSISEVVEALPKAWGQSGQLPRGKSVEQGTFH